MTNDFDYHQIIATGTAGVDHSRFGLSPGCSGSCMWSCVICSCEFRSPRMGFAVTYHTDNREDGHHVCRDCCEIYKPDQWERVQWI